MLSIDAYISKAWSDLDAYLEGVQSGNTMVGKFEKLAIDRYYNDLEREDLIYRKDRVDKVIAFFSLLNIAFNGKKVQFPLLGFQVFILSNLFGFYWKHQNKRRFDTAQIFMAKKNGKSSFMAALQLYFICADNVFNSNAFIFAKTKEQARIAYQESANLVRQSPLIKKNFTIAIHELRYKSKQYGVATAKAISSENPEAADGKIFSCAIADEVHSYADSGMLDLMKAGLVFPNSLFMIISTAGHNKYGPCYELMELSRQILKNEVSMDNVFCMLFELDEDDNPYDEKNWRKANPGIDQTGITYEKLRSILNEAQRLPSLLNTFLVKNMNCWVDAATEWIPSKTIDNQSIDIPLEAFRGKACTMAIDLSVNTDFSSFTLMAHDPDNNRIISRNFFYVVKSEKLKGHVAKMVDSWILEGHVKEHKRSIDLDAIVMDIRELIDTYELQIQKFYYDILNASQLVLKLTNDYYIDCESFSQAPGKYNEPTRFTEKYLNDSVLFMHNNPILKYMFRNVVIVSNGYGNIKPDKNKSKAAIDGVMSLVMALGGQLDSNRDTLNQLFSSYEYKEA